MAPPYPFAQRGLAARASFGGDGLVIGIVAPELGVVAPELVASTRFLDTQLATSDMRGSAGESLWPRLQLFIHFALARDDWQRRGSPMVRSNRVEARVMIAAMLLQVSVPAVGQSTQPTLPESQEQRGFDLVMKRVEAAFLEPTLANPPSTPDSSVSKPPATTGSANRVCKASVSKGLKAHLAGDNETALCHWLPKARAGDAAAQNNMGVLFQGGLTTQTPQDDEQAAQWYSLSANQGFVPAMQNLAALQSRVGNIAAADSWRALAAATAQNQMAIRQQNASALGYALGCALGGGCRSAAPLAPALSTPSYQPTPTYQRNRAPVVFSEPNPVPSYQALRMVSQGVV